MIAMPAAAHGEFDTCYGSFRCNGICFTMAQWSSFCSLNLFYPIWIFSIISSFQVLGLITKIRGVSDYYFFRLRTGGFFDIITGC